MKKILRILCLIVVSPVLVTILIACVLATLLKFGATGEWDWMGVDIWR